MSAHQKPGTCPFYTLSGRKENLVLDRILDIMNQIS